MQGLRVFKELITSLKFYSTIRNATSLSKESIKVGQKVSVLKKVTDEDIINFCKLTNDFNPIHVSANPKIAHGALLNGFLSGVLGTKLPGPGIIVIEQFIDYPNPCFAGDTIEITVEVLSARKIIKCAYQLVANGKKVVLQGEGKFVANALVRKFNLDSQ